MNESALKIMREIKLSSVRQQLYDILGRMHVATAPETVANEVIRLFGGHDVWNTLSPSRRRGGATWPRSPPRCGPASCISTST